MSNAAHSGSVQRIGPNAITRVAEALGAPLSAAVFQRAGLAHYLQSPPQRMIPEQEVSDLHQALRAELGCDQARQIGWQAGRLTGAYLLAHRIPFAAQRLLRILPPRLASALLLKAITRHAWTFAGSAAFSARAGHPTRLSIAGCTICRNSQADMTLCDYYAATFETLFSTLVSRNAHATETDCQALGAAACTFEIRWH